MNNEIILHITDPESLEAIPVFDSTNFFTIKMFNGYKLKLYGKRYIEDNTTHIEVESFSNY